MALINIRSLYPFYKCDCFIEIPDDVLNVIRDCNRAEKAYQRKLRYHKVKTETLDVENADEIAMRIILKSEKTADIAKDTRLASNKSEFFLSLSNRIKTPLPNLYLYAFNAFIDLLEQ